MFIADNMGLMIRWLILIALQGISIEHNNFGENDDHQLEKIDVQIA